MFSFRFVFSLLIYFFSSAVASLLSNKVHRLAVADAGAQVYTVHRFDLLIFFFIHSLLCVCRL